LDAKSVPGPRRFSALLRGIAPGANGARFGNLANLNNAGVLGRASQVRTAEQFAAGLFPVIEAVKKAGATSLAEIADALNERGVR